MVRQLYLTVHGANPTAVFGISPQGNMSSDFDTLYADIYTWCGSSGYCDYICPQIYYGFENSTLPYAETVDSWAKLTGDNISLVIGLAAYKSGTEDTYAGHGKTSGWIQAISFPASVTLRKYTAQAMPFSAMIRCLSLHSLFRFM